MRSVRQTLEFYYIKNSRSDHLHRNDFSSAYFCIIYEWSSVICMLLAVYLLFVFILTSNSTSSMYTLHYMLLIVKVYRYYYVLPLPAYYNMFVVVEIQFYFRKTIWIHNALVKRSDHTVFK